MTIRLIVQWYLCTRDDVLHLNDLDRYREKRSENTVTSHRCRYILSSFLFSPLFCCCCCTWLNQSLAIQSPRPIHSLSLLSRFLLFLFDRFSRYVHFAFAFIHHHRIISDSVQFVMPKSTSAHRYITEKSSPIYLRPRKLFCDEDIDSVDLQVHHRPANQLLTSALARLTTRTPPSASTTQHTVVIRTSVPQTPLSSQRRHLQTLDVNICQQDAHSSIKRIKRQQMENPSTPVPLRRVSD